MAFCKPNELNREKETRSLTRVWNPINMYEYIVGKDYLMSLGI